MHWLNPSAVLYFRNPSMDFDMESAGFDLDEPGELWFIRNSSVLGKMSIAVRRVAVRPFGNEKTRA